MNTAYAQHASPPHDMRGVPVENQQYRQGPPYPPQTMPLPQQSQVPPPYGDPYNQQNPQRPHLPEGIHNGEMPTALAPLIPGTQPPSTDPQPRSCTFQGRNYELQVVQQPQRARMCGFGDKDRRPITPPPCVKLIVTQVDTGKEADFNEIEHGMFVLNVDLWSADGRTPVNLVRHSANSPSISSTVPVSYADATSPSYAPQGAIKYEGGQQPPYNPYPGQPQVNPYSGGQAQAYGQAPQTQYHQQGYPPPTNGSQQYPPQNGYSQPPQQQMYYGVTTGAGIHAAASGGSAPGIDYNQNPQAMQQYGGGRQFPQGELNNRLPLTNPPSGMYTRNLIGSLAASAFRLTDPDDKIGIWFVLQDLSVRTEGVFRLRFSFVNVGETSPTTPGSNQPPTTVINTKKAPVLACCFSETFQVFSAKRFPGVVESTPLSKCFATQGIKIPIRKDGAGKGDKDKDFEDD